MISVINRERFDNVSVLQSECKGNEIERPFLPLAKTQLTIVKKRELLLSTTRTVIITLKCIMESLSGKELSSFKTH